MVQNWDKTQYFFWGSKILVTTIKVAIVYLLDNAALDKGIITSLCVRYIGTRFYEHFTNMQCSMPKTPRAEAVAPYFNHLTSRRRPKITG